MTGEKCEVGYIRMEKVLSMVAAKPRYQPVIPSFLYIRSKIAIMDNSSLPFPFGKAWILVFALCPKGM